MCFLLWNTQPLKNGSLLPQVTLLSLVPSKELACVRLLRKCESQTPPLCCAVATWGLLSVRETFSLGFLPFRSLPLNQVQSPRGRWPDDQMHCPGRPRANGAVPSPAKDCPSLQQNSGEKEDPSPGCPHIGASQFSPFSHLMASWTHGKLKEFFQP